MFAAFQFSELTKQSLERQREKTLTTSVITNILHKHQIQFFVLISKSAILKSTKEKGWIILLLGHA